MPQSKMWLDRSGWQQALTCGIDHERLVSFAGSQAARYGRQAAGRVDVFIKAPALPAHSPAGIAVPPQGGDGMAETLLALLRKPK